MCIAAHPLDLLALAAAAFYSGMSVLIQCVPIERRIYPESKLCGRIHHRR